MGITLRWATKPLTALVLASTLLVSACSSSSSSSSSNGDIVVGATGPLTGHYAAIKVLLDGANAYFADVNAKGGIGGHKIRFIAKDDQYNPALTPQLVRQMVEDNGARMICDLVGSAPYAAVNTYLGSKGIIGIPASGSTALLNDHTYEVLASYGPLAARLVSYSLDQLKLTNIAIAYSSDDVGQPFYDGAVQALQQRGVKPVTIVKFDASATDFSSQAAQLKNSGAQIVLVNHVAAIVAQLQNAAAKIGYTPKWGSSFTAVQPQLIQLAPTEAVNTYFATPNVLPNSTDAADFRAAMQKYEPKTDLSGGYPIEGYTIASGCGAVLEQAVKLAGGKVPTAAQIGQAAASITINNSVIRNLTWSSSDHSGEKASQILAIQGQDFVTVDGFKSPDGK